ncbi:unnamed protein product, partial [Discosporangium mesarthrocarpum]
VCSSTRFTRCGQVGQGHQRRVQQPHGAEHLGSGTPSSGPQACGLTLALQDQNQRPYKARFVAQGFSQVPGVDYFATFAPVARMSSVRLLLSLAAEYNWDLVHLDVKTAFLQSELKEEIYVRQPRGFEKHSPSGAPYACRLRRSLY